MHKTLLLIFFIVTVSSAQVEYGAVPAAPVAHRPALRKSPAVTTRIMPIGDSITELDWQGGYRAALYKLLSDSAIDFDFVGTKTTNHDDANLGFPFPQEYWDHEGYNSATITVKTGSVWIWNENIETKVAANPPDVALVLLGTNDLDDGCCSVAEIIADMSAFLDQIWSVDSSIVVILGSPPSVDSSRYPALNDRIAEYHALLPSLVGAKIVLGHRIALADHHAVMNSGSDLVGDGIHPSPAGYRKMAQVWYDAIDSEVILPADIGDGTGELPGEFALMQNYPNPFNPGTTLRYALPVQARVTLRIFNVLGEEIALLVDEDQPPGVMEAQWDAGSWPAGVYFYRITAGISGGTGKMVLMK